MEDMKLLYIREILAATVLLLATAGGAAEVHFIESPFGSLGKTRQLLDAADLRIMLPLGYARWGGQGELDGRAGVVENRVYIKEDYGIEIAIAAGVGGGYDFVLTGNAEGDLAEIHERLKALAKKGKSRKSAEPDLAYEMFRLGHIEADRALALLKALGYHTVEFEAKSSKTARYETIFQVVQGKKPKLPWVVKVANASKTSLLQTDPISKAKATSSRKNQGAPQLGGSHLHNTTTGAPQERLLFVYDRNDLEPLERLVNVLRTQIDLPAQQIVIEALVIEVNTSQLNDLGFEFNGKQKNASLSFQRAQSGNSLTTFLFSRDGFGDFIDFRGKLEALKETGDAEVLSSPSVLVLNDRQARIQVGQQIPISKTTAVQGAGSVKGIEYLPVGIVLNLRPRINREGTEVTMQIETIISSISVESAARLEQGVSGIEFSPIIDNRLVETYVRVADGTPFIIGGLLSTEQQGSRTEVPLLGGLPFVGRLFSRERLETEQREVIVVITPHIVPLKDNSFSYLIPKDSDIFDRFNTKLFRNAYRVRDDDVWDLKFVQESPVFTALQARVRAVAAEDVMLQRKEPFHSLLQGRIPGEGVLVRRMLLEIVGNLGFASEVKLDQVFFFTPADEKSVRRFSDDLTLLDLLPRALASPESAVIMSFEAQPSPEPGHAFGLPIATVRDTVLPVEEQDELMWVLNEYDENAVPIKWSILLANEDDVARLCQALILKRVLKLNQNMAQTMQGFRPGVQILFPTREDMRNRYHPIDREVAKLFYESKYPYLVSERIFNETVHQVEQSLGGGR